MKNTKTTLVQSEATELISALAARRHDYIGLDIGGSKIEIIRWKEGHIVKTARIKTPQNKEDFIKGLTGAIVEMGLVGVNGVGVAMAGALDYKKGVILNSPNLKFLDGTPLVKILEEKLGIEVRMDNDTKCFLLAECRFGRASGIKNVVELTMGTGIGGAVMIDGKLYRGAHGTAGEIGHTVIDKGKDVEAFISRHGFKRLGVRDPKKAGKKAFRVVGKYLGIALANIINIFDPEMIVLSGGISRDAEKFLPEAIKEMKKYLLLPQDLQPEIIVSKLEHAGSLGAVALFLE